MKNVKDHITTSWKKQCVVTDYVMWNVGTFVWSKASECVLRHIWEVEDTIRISLENEIIMSIK